MNNVVFFPGLYTKEAKLLCREKLKHSPRFRERISGVARQHYAPQFYIGAVAIGDGASGFGLVGCFGVGFHSGWQVTQCLPSQSVFLLRPAVPILQQE